MKRQRLAHRLLLAALAAFTLGAAPGWAAEASPAEKTRAAFLKIIDRPRVPLAPEYKEASEAGGLIQEHFTFASDSRQRVPGILVRPAQGGGRRPVVIAMHGTSSKKESHLALLKKYAAKGFVGVAIDGRYHGERTKAGSGDVEYCEAIARAFAENEKNEQKEHPFYYDTVWDLLRLIDYLETRPDVDGKRIGVIGFSKGGIECYLASAADQRIAVSVPCIGVQSFRHGLEHGGWEARVGTVRKAVNAITKESGKELDVEFARRFFDRLVPGIYSDFDGPVMLTLIAPRPLLVISGDSDKNTPLAGVRECEAAASKAYAAAGVAERFVLRVQEKTGHSVTPESSEAALQWFIKHLAP